MKINYTSPLLGILFFALFSTPLYSQKPNEIRAFEKRIVENENSYQEGNTRISSESGYPLAIYNPDFALGPDEPHNMALEYLRANKILLGLTDKDIDNLILHAIRESDSGTTVRLRQHYNDLPVGKAEVTIHINTKNIVSFVMNSFRYGIELADTKAGKTAEFARQTLLNEIGVDAHIIQERQNLEIFYNEGDEKLIYRTTINSDNPVGEWEAFVDAQSGELLKLEDVSFYYHDHKEALLPGIAPSQTFAFMINGTGTAFVPDPLSSATADYNDPGYSDNNDAASPQLSAETMTITLEDITFDGTDYQLIGPWAEIVDSESPLNGLYSQPTSTWSFNRFDDGFEATNTYYHIDQSMRYINNDLGLSIQPTDYPGGVKFDPHGLGGADNSHYSGGTQIVAFGEGGVDDAEDSDVIHHELGHGLHDWVTNGGLSQVNGLSEGCGDYWAASYNRSLGLWSPTDDPYHWVFNWDGHNPFWNGRVVNYAPIYPGGLTGSIHRDGQIWATAMMKVWDAIGGDRSDRIFWEGLGMTNGSSNQNDAANAVYQAAVNFGYPNGDLTSIHDELESSGYTLPPLPLPIELASFDGFIDNKDIRLFWSTASELNNEYFDIERSLDGKSFAPIGKVASQFSDFGNSDYEFTDQQPYPGTNYYRLKQVDLDGKYTYSNVLTFTFEPIQKVAVFPNPAVHSLMIQSDLLNEPTAMISVYDAVGKLRMNVAPASAKEAQFMLDVSRLGNGMYTLKIESGNWVEVVRFQK